jgi:predicted kinase
MFNVCLQCGAYHADKEIDPEVPAAVCPACGHAHPFRRLPLFLICGASGTGKSAICNDLAGRFDAAVLLEGDILWRPDFDRPEDGYRDLFETWLRLAKNIGQAGRPVAVFMAGATPQHVESCIERRYFSATHYLALTCKDDLLRSRLRARPGWRDAGTSPFVARQVEFNAHLRAAGAAGVLATVDTSALTVAAAADAVAGWLSARLTQTALHSGL